MKRFPLLLAILIFAILLCSLLTLTVASGSVESYAKEDVHPTGLIEPTAAQTEWMRENVPLIKNICLNSFALDRINQDRFAKGLPELSTSDVEIAPFGKELDYTNSTEITYYKPGIAEMGNSLPSSVDNSLSPAFPPIGDQGSLGSCAAFATTYYALTYETNFARNRIASNGNATNIFSPKWTYNLINYGVDGGSYFADAFDLLMKHGAATCAQFPYNSNYLQWCLNKDTWRSAINYRASNWSQIYNSDTAVCRCHRICHRSLYRLWASRSCQ